MTSRDDPNWGWEFRAEDFVYARLNEDQAAADQLPTGPDRDAVLQRVAALRQVLAEHSIYVVADTPAARESYESMRRLGMQSTQPGTSAGRCITCEATSGVPCATVIALARMWRSHPDYPYPDEDPARAARPEDVVAAGTYRRLRWPETITP